MPICTCLQVLAHACTRMYTTHTHTHTKAMMSLSTAEAMMSWPVVVFKTCPALRTFNAMPMELGDKHAPTANASLKSSPMSRPRPRPVRVYVYVYVYIMYTYVVAYVRVYVYLKVMLYINTVMCGWYS